MKELLKFSPIIIKKIESKTSLCLRHRFADSIAFAGSTMATKKRIAAIMNTLGNLFIFSTISFSVDWPGILFP